MHNRTCCRINDDADRASMHPLADAVEMRYQIGGTQPMVAGSVTDFHISKKALFTFEAGQQNGGQWFYVFCRYVNLSNAANNGPWSVVHSATIQG